MKSAPIVAALLAITLAGSATAPAFAAKNNGGGGGIDSEACKKLERRYADLIWQAADQPTELRERKVLMQAMGVLDAARYLKCPWAKDVTVPF